MKSLLLIISCLFIFACSTPAQVNNSTFTKEYQNSKILHTMHSYEYLGQKDGNVYLKKRSMSLINQKKWHEKIFVGQLNELNPELQKELLALNKPYLSE